MHCMHVCMILTCWFMYITKLFTIYTFMILIVYGYNIFMNHTWSCIILTYSCLILTLSICHAWSVPAHVCFMYIIWNTFLTSYTLHNTHAWSFHNHNTFHVQFIALMHHPCMYMHDPCMCMHDPCMYVYNTCTVQAWFIHDRSVWVLSFLFTVHLSLLSRLIVSSLSPLCVYSVCSRAQSVFSYLQQIIMFRESPPARFSCSEQIR